MRNRLPVVLAAVGGAALLLFLLLLVRSRSDVLLSWARGMGPSAGRFARERTAGHPLIEMIVTMQNRHIGFRNVHSMRSGSVRSVGGGRSDYLIYFVRVPANIGLFRRDGDSYTFVPRLPEYFPEIRGEARDCLLSELPAQTARGYRFTIVFRPYRCALDEINALMQSVKRPAPG